MPLNFGGQKRSGAFDTVWPPAKIHVAARDKVFLNLFSKSDRAWLDVCVCDIMRVASHASYFCLPAKHLVSASLYLDSNDVLTLLVVAQKHDLERNVGASCWIFAQL